MQGIPPGQGTLVETGVDTLEIFGRTFQKKYIYILATVLVVVLAYVFWKWYTKSEKDDDDDSTMDESEDIPTDQHDYLNYEQNLRQRYLANNMNPNIKSNEIYEKDRDREISREKTGEFDEKNLDKIQLHINKETKNKKKDIDVENVIYDS